MSALYQYPGINTSRIRDQLKETSALQREPWAVQEEMLVIFNSSLAQTGGTYAVEVMPVSAIAQVLNSTRN